MTSGPDHLITDADDGTIIRRRRPGSQALSAGSESSLLEAVRDHLPLPVPRILHVIDDDTMVMERLPGEPLLTHLSGLGDTQRQVLAAELGRFVAAAAAVPVATVLHLLPVGVAQLESYRAQSLGLLHSHLGQLHGSRRAAVVRFVKRACPPPARRQFFTHHDLGAEHVLVQGWPPRISGVIDFSDAVIADPAHDLGLILRDFGTKAGGCGYAAFLAAGGNADGTLMRALFYARVKALEDLAFGIERSSGMHHANAVRAIDDLFADVA